jgi:hypothetical protein
METVIPPARAVPAPRPAGTLSGVKTAGRGLLAALVLLAVAVAARGPLHRATFALPVSNDDAILLLMARHALRGELATTLWNQPYNGALDAYLLAPLVALLPPHAAYRLYEAACAGLLVWLAFLLGRRLGGAPAGWGAALLAACGTPYMALMAATGPPPNFLMPLVTGFPLAAALASRPLAPWTVGALGLVCGLAVWTSSLAIPAFAGIAAGLLLAGFRPRAPAVPAFLAGAALGALPIALGRALGASGAKVVTASSAVTALRPRWQWADGASALGKALAGLTGLQVPLVVDGRERAFLPPLLAVLLGAGLLLAVGLGGRTRRALPLVGWAAALAGAFWLSRRSGPDDLRYLYGMNAPLLALAGAGVAAAWGWRRPAGLALAAALLVPWAWGGRALARAWQDPAHAERVWEVPSLDPVVAALRERDVRSGYASLQFAGRLTLETRGEVIASQAWNERIPGDPLRFRDEVDLDPAPAWVLSPRFSRGMPRPAGFREALAALGGSFREEEAGGFVVFAGFVPPYDESRPVPAAEVSVAATSGAALGPAVRDRDPATAWISAEGIARGGGLVVRAGAARRLSAVVLAVDLDASPLAVPWVAQLGGAVVARGPARAGLQWVNGAPRAGKQALLAVALGDRRASEVRLLFQGPGPRLAVAEVFLYGPDEPARPRAGARREAEALEAARAGRWDEAVARYADALRLEPERASLHAGWARARWRASSRRRLDVESLDDGGPELVEVR